MSSSSGICSGDWGDLDEEDRSLNDAAVIDGSRILSAYTTRKGERLWVITEAADDEGLPPLHNDPLGFGVLGDVGGLIGRPVTNDEYFPMNTKYSDQHTPLMDADLQGDEQDQQQGIYRADDNIAGKEDHCPYAGSPERKAKQVRISQRTAQIRSRQLQHRDNREM